VERNLVRIHIERLACARCGESLEIQGKSRHSPTRRAWRPRAQGTATGTASNQTHAIDTAEQRCDRIVERVHELRAEQITERTGEGCAQSRCRCGMDGQHATGLTLARRGTQHSLPSPDPSGHERHGQSDWQRLPVAAEVPSIAAWWAMAAGFA
jgi:hypothetical protein